MNDHKYISFKDFYSGTLQDGRKNHLFWSGGSLQSLRLACCFPSPFLYQIEDGLLPLFYV